MERGARIFSIPKGGGQVKIRIGLRVQFVVLVTILLAMSVGVNTLVAVNSQRDSLMQERKLRGMAVLRSWAAVCRERLISGDPTMELSMYDLVDDIRKNEEGVVEIFLQDETGKILIAEDPKRTGSPSPDTLFARLLYAPQSGVFVTSKHGEPVLQFYAPIVSGNHHFGVARIVFSSEGIEKGIWEVIVALLTATGVVMVVGMLLTILLVLKITGPVRLLKQGVQEFGKRFNPAIPETANFQVQFKASNELGDVRDAFNEMTHTLHATLEDRIRLKDEATHDAMTGLFNKRQYQEDYPELLRLSREKKASLTMMMLDMDRFKVLNDTVGHKAGDKALQDLAKCIRGRIRDRDRAYRIGGDEFIIILVGVGLEVARQQSERIAELYDQTKAPENMTGISFGIVEYAGEQPDEFFQKADAEMYRIKKEKKAAR